MFAALTCAGAFIKIPIPGYPVPFTLQTFFVIGASFLLPPLWAFASQAVYLTLGLIGLPVFANGGGLGYVFQPSFGFLVSFAVSAPALSALLRKTKVLFMKPGFKRLLLASACSLLTLVIIYGIGVPYMYLAINVFLSKSFSVWDAVYGGCILFLPFDIIKIVLASYIGTLLYSRVEHSTG